jgi:hypothetical protein
MKKNASTLSTLMGYLVAVAQAWVNIDWSHFEPTQTWFIKNLPPLLLSAVIALGGHLTRLNMKEN